MKWFLLILRHIIQNFVLWFVRNYLTLSICTYLYLCTCISFSAGLGDFKCNISSVCLAWWHRTFCTIYILDALILQYEIHQLHLFSKYKIYWYRNDYRRWPIIARHVISPQRAYICTDFKIWLHRTKLDIPNLSIINANLDSCPHEKSWNNVDGDNG